MRKINNLMEILLIEDFSKCDDPVKTEQTIFQNLIKREIKSNYSYVVFPIAWTINNYGLQYCQNKIDNICKKYANKKLFFVCQHIQVKNLNFHGNLVFTPHATFLDNFSSIPHYAANFFAGDKKNKFLKRKYLLSFRGSFQTHSTRSMLKQVLKEREEDCEIIDTGCWHFEKENQIENSKKYIQSLGETKIAICPRGTGPSTIRFWEAMASGCVPMLISDFLKMPLSLRVPWEHFILRVSERDVGNIFKKVPDEDNLKRMSEISREIYYKYFSNENLHKSVEMCI